MPPPPGYPSYAPSLWIVGRAVWQRATDLTIVVGLLKRQHGHP